MSDSGLGARHSSATAEHYTPPHVVEAARITLGGFDLDPFSCARANQVVRATTYYTAEGNSGFDEPWRGRCFVNPPGGKSGNDSNQKHAWFKLMRECAAGNCDAAVFVAFSLEMLQTTQVKTAGRLPLHFPICYPSRRLQYHLERTDQEELPLTGGAMRYGHSPPHASCVILVPVEIDRGAGDMIERFRIVFGSIGHVVVPEGWRSA